MRTGMIAQRSRQPLPEVLARRGIVEQIAGTQDRVHAVPPADVEDPVDDVHARARQLPLRLLRERRKSASQVPVRGVQQPQHDVAALDGTIRNVTWNSRVTTGAR